MFKKKPDSIRQGQIYLVDLPEIAGSIQRGQRPMIITSSDSRNHAASVVNASVVTSKIKRLDLPDHILLPKIKWLPERSMVCCEQDFPLDKSQLIGYYGRLPWFTYKRVDRGVRKARRSSKEEYEKEW